MGWNLPSIMKVSAASVSALVMVLVQTLVPPAAGYSLDQDHSLEFKGPPSSMFGYSVLLYRHNTESWLVVGAPVANTSSDHSVSPGAVLRCSIAAAGPRKYVSWCGKTCEAEQDHQWMGVSLSRQPEKEGGHILACGHRWKNVFYSKKDGQNNKLPNGVCYRFGSDMKTYKAMTPCYRDHQRKFGEDYGSCQAGISNFLTEDLVIMGAPGTSYWTGSVLVYNSTSGKISAYLDNDNTEAVKFGSYLGYSVGAGHFLSPASVEVVGGAPQYNQKGKVFIFTVDNSVLQIVAQVSGKELGSYFGSSVCAVDLNADGLSDLLVGAPMATGNVREEGRVHVYINQGQVEEQFQLTGSNAYAARFGESIADLGDLDDDGYPDVVIGAPHEDDLKGAVYIYNGRKEGISSTPSQRITGSTLGHDLRMFGQSLSSGIDIDDNGYKDVAVGAFLSDSAVVLRTRPVIQVNASLILPEQIDDRMALCRELKHPAPCFNVTICFSVQSRHFRGHIDLQYNLTSDLLHKPSFPPRFYFHGNGSSNITNERVRARQGHLTCVAHVAYQRKDVRDIFTPVQFVVSYSLRETNSRRASSTSFPPLKPILQRSAGHRNTITSQTRFARSCSLVNCSTNMQLSAHLVLPHQQEYFALGSGQTIMLKASLLNSGDDAFLPRLTLRLPSNIHYIKVLQNLYRLLNLESNHQGVKICEIYFLCSDNYERREYLHDNSISLTLPLKYGVNVNIHGFVTPSSFEVRDEDLISTNCYSESFNYTYKVLNSGPSRSVDTVVEIALPKILTPYRHRLLQVVDWQSSQGVCYISDTTVSVIDDCNAPQASFIKQLIFFFSPTSTRRMFCGRTDKACEWLVCRLGNLEAGREVTIQLEANLNPAVLRQAPGRHGIMILESMAVMSSPKQDNNTILIQDHPVVLVEAVFTQKPSAMVKIFIVVVSLAVGLTILAALIWCLWKAGFFKRELHHKEDEFNRDSWDFVPKHSKRESTT
uniref:Integrin alpha-2 domain-containing protein n=1 Tax=Astatotilapia calliptera TaxID=8154 RepID=A0AAX7VW98_ASTCA